MIDVFNQISDLIRDNQILSTVAGGSVIVWLVSNIKNMFRLIVSWTHALISFEIVNSYEDTRRSVHGMSITTEQDIFNELISQSKVYWERTKNLDLGTAHCVLSQDDERNDENSGPVLDTNSASGSVLTYGFSVRNLFGKLVTCNRSIERGQKIVVVTTLRVYFASKKKFMKKLEDSILEATLEHITKAGDNKYVTVNSGNRDICYGHKLKRSLDSIFTNNDEHRKLYESIVTFIGNRDKYAQLSYPYSYSALLYGKPGCGKSSTILALASALGRNVVYINLSRATLDGLVGCINCFKGNLFVFEDVDAIDASVNEKRADNATGGVDEKPDDRFAASAPPPRAATNKELLSIASLSDILNITDGLLASDGSICIFTTNHIEKLDPAFLRAGRMNMLVEFDELNGQTAAKMVKANLGWEFDSSRFPKRTNPAELQTGILHVILGKMTRNEFEQKFLDGAAG